MKAPKVDMSPEAISRRFREWSKLWRLWQKMRKAKDMGPLTGPPPARTKPAPAAAVNSAKPAPAPKAKPHTEARAVQPASSAKRSPERRPR